jgi:hypothetical protein
MRVLEDADPPFIKCASCSNSSRLGTETRGLQAPSEWRSDESESEREILRSTTESQGKRSSLLVQSTPD